MYNSSRIHNGNMFLSDDRILVEYFCSIPPCLYHIKTTDFIEILISDPGDEVSSSTVQGNVQGSQ